MKLRITVLSLVLAILTVACQQDSKNQPTLPSQFDIAVFVPGVVQGSPTYEMMVDGVQKAVATMTQSGVAVTVKIIEGGFNQGAWKEGIAALAASSAYELIVSSNPSIPELCAEVSLNFPNQKFLLLDGYLEGNNAIKTVAFDQFQQAWLNGHFAGLVTTSTMQGANTALVIGLLAGQEYPVMNEQIRTGFLAGARAVNPQITLDFRVLGNWYDASKASSLAREMISNKADVILAIAGGGNQGVVSAAKEKGAYVLWYDSPGYENGPGTVLAASIVRQANATQDAVEAAIRGTLVYGKATVLGIRDGAVSFDTESALYVQHVPQAIRDLQAAKLEAFLNGSEALPVH